MCGAEADGLKENLMKIEGRQSGFTLIELIVVIVILGILAAVAMPKFVDFSGDARQSALNGLVGAISAASASNRNDCIADPNNQARCKMLNQANVCTLAILTPLVAGLTVSGSNLQFGSNSYSLAGTGNCSAAAAAATVSCTLTDTVKTSLSATVPITCSR